MNGHPVYRNKTLLLIFLALNKQQDKQTRSTEENMHVGTRIANAVATDALQIFRRFDDSDHEP